MAIRIDQRKKFSDRIQSTSLQVFVVFLLLVTLRSWESFANLLNDFSIPSSPSSFDLPSNVSLAVWTNLNEKIPKVTEAASSLIAELGLPETTTSTEYPLPPLPGPPDLSIKEFEKQDGVAIVTKVQGPNQIGLLRQSLCLLHFAYNDRLQYDIVVFTTDPLPDELLAELRSTIHPVKLTVVADNVGLQQEIDNLSPLRRQKFLERCQPTARENITWWTYCEEPMITAKGKPVLGRLAYNWQAEFRSTRIWRHPALKEYKTMLWLDTDGFATRVWPRDPVAIFRQHQLTIFFGNFPQGSARGDDIYDRIAQSFDNKTICSVKLENGHLVSTSGHNCSRRSIPDVHGFFHITELDFYRSDIVHEFEKNLIGDCFLCRKYDDQHGVTIPAAMLRPEQSWDMYENNVTLSVFHNNVLDGKANKRAGGFIKYWKEHGQADFEEAFGKCSITEGG